MNDVLKMAELKPCPFCGGGRCRRWTMSGSNDQLFCLNDQVGSVMSVTENRTGALRSEEHGHSPCVCLDMTHACDVIRECGEIVPGLQARMETGGNNVPLVLKIRSGCEGGGKGPLIQTDKSATLSCNNDQTLLEPCSWDGGQISPTLTKQNAGGGQRMPDKDNFNCVLQPFGICSKDSNAMKSSNPHSGIYEADTSRTIERELQPTIVAKGPGAVAQDEAGYTVRRLTPTECARLQGFPDGWVDIGDWVDTKGKKHKDADSPKYKALGNSIALPFWRWMFQRMAEYLPEKASLGSLFDGIGGFPKCWEDVHGAGTALWASEIEEFPIAVTKTRFPGTEHLGDITKLNGAKLKPVHAVAGGSPCFPAGTLVNTADGMKPIECVSINDKVLSHTGVYRQVLDARYTGTKPVLKLKAMGIDEIEATTNHRFLIRTKTRIWDNVRRTNKRVFSKPQWTELKDIHRGDYLCVPIIQTQENCLELTREECWLIGRYIADGYLRNGQRPNRPDGSKFNTVTFCIGKGKQDAFERHLLTHKAGKYFDGNVTKYSICDSRLLHLCEMCGKGAKNKLIPTAILNLPVDLLAEVIDGYMSGDGCCVRGRYKATTVSRTLAYSLGAAVAKAYRVPYCIYRVNVSETTVIEGRTVNQKTIYQVTFKKDSCKQDKAFYENDCIWVPVNSVSITEEKKAVYDLTVAKDHSFCVLNVAAHNCQDLSVAGKRKGLEGKRSGLFIHQIRVVKEMRESSEQSGADEPVWPRYMVWENVPGALSCNGGRDFAAVLEETIRIADPEAPGIDVPEKGWPNWGGYRDVDGRWSVAWRVHDAQFWGVPQRRRRISLVADFGGDTAHEILFERKSLSGDPEPGTEAGEGTPGSPAGCADTAEQNHVTPYCISSYQSNAMQSDNPHSGIYKADVARTLDLNGGSPACNQGGVMVVYEEKEDNNATD